MADEGMGKIYKWIEFHIRNGNCGGSLVQFQEGLEEKNALPFNIKKVLVSLDMSPDDIRGNHAHYETEEIVVALNGGCIFDLDDGKGHIDRIHLTAKKNKDVVYALLLHPHIWRTFHTFEPGTVLLIIANMEYNEADYIRDRNVFDQLAQTWLTLGGSAKNI